MIFIIFFVTYIKLYTHIYKYIYIKYPEFYSFPPFFTIQPVLATREKQLGLWRSLILQYYTKHKMKILVVHECPLWKNTMISRSLNSYAIQTIMNDFVKR